jgi:hypothetical protein
MSQYVFGTGQVFSTPVGGGAPLRFGALQDVSVDFSGDIKQLFGQYQYALDTARGKTKIEWKAATGNIDIVAFNSIFFGQTSGLTTGTELKQIFNEAAEIPATPFKVTAGERRNGFFNDLGVYFADTGLPLVQVAAGPTTGQYAVNPVTGEYTFAAADTTKMCCSTISMMTSRRRRLVGDLEPAHRHDSEDAAHPVAALRQQDLHPGPLQLRLG